MKTKLIRTLLIVFALATFAWAQTTYIMLGTYQGMSYEVELKPEGTTAKLRRKLLTGEHKDFSVVSDWSFDCPSRTIKEVHRALYSPDGQLLVEQDIDAEWLETEKGSFARQALDKYWCTDNF